MTFDAFEKEMETLRRSQEVLGDGGDPDYPAEYRTLAGAYDRLLKVARKLVKTGDLKENYLKEANATIRRQEAALREAHALLSRHSRQLEEKINEFEEIFNNSSVGVALVAQSGDIRRGNRRFFELIGADESNPSSACLADLMVKAGEFNRPGEAFSADREGVLTCERQIRRGDGRIFWGRLSEKAVDPADPEAGFIWILDDVSGAKELERLRGDVERIMQHDLKSPLNGIINFPELIAADGNLTAEQLELLEHIAASGRRMLRQINLSRDIYKMETGTYACLPSVIDLAGVARKVMLDLKGLADSRQVAVRALFEDRSLEKEERLPAMADETLCCEAAGNLLKNAIEASGPGETVEVRLWDDGRAALSISNPADVPEEIRPIFFKKYATFGKTGGSGLGAYGAKLMVEALAGELEAITGQGRGTMVVMRFPAARARGPATA